MTDDGFTKALFFKVDWTPRDGGGCLATIDGLGLVEIYRSEGGYCCDINGKRHSSAYREGESGAKSRMTDEIRSWVYLNWFRPFKPHSNQG